MTSEPPPPESPDAGEARDELTVVRDLLAHATQRMLGDTIGLSDEQWRAPSALPGWTRGHVATHVARNADAIGQLATWAASGRRQEMYASPGARDAEIERGADRPGLELQVDLDTSAGLLTEAFAALDQSDQWTEQVEGRAGQPLPARLLPLMRLAEIVLHHVDLDCGFGVEDVEPDTALWLLQLAAHRVSAQPDYPALTLQPTGADPVDLGPATGDRTTVSGAAAALLGLVTQRGDATTLTGAEGLDLPSYG